MIEGLRSSLMMVGKEVGWLPQLPAHWEVMRAKHVFREVDCRSVDGSEIHLSMHQKLGLVPSATTGEKRLVSESYAGGKLVEPDDLVLNRLKAHLGVFAHANQPGVISPDYTVLRPLPNAVVRYFEYLLKSPACRGELRTRIKGIVEGFWRLYTDDFYDIRLPVPPPDEQRLIVRFLDWHGAMTGKLIRAKRRLIALLNEQKQSIIHRAVTRGLDPAAKLKPSGVDWLRDVPEHWEVAPLKRLVRMQSGEGITATLIDEAGPFPVYGGNGLRGYTRRSTHNGQFILIGRQGALCGNVHLVNGEFFASEHAIVAHPRVTFDALWLAAVIEVMNLNQYSIAAAQPGLSVERIEALKVSIPPLEEQRSLAAAIRSETSGVDHAVAGVQREIALIQEFRTRLIADVVTGQLDVRAVAASLPDVGEADAAVDLTDEDDLDEDADAIIDEEEAA